jgi:hypothetical protein
VGVNLKKNTNGAACPGEGTIRKTPSSVLIFWAIDSERRGFPDNARRFERKKSSSVNR